MFFLSPFNNNLMKTNKNFYDMVEDFFDGVFPRSTFKIDVKEDDKAYYFDAELPGVKKEEIKLEYKDDHLIIAVHRENKIDEEKDNYIRRERSMASMQRSFYLENVIDENIEAKLEDGILKIMVPKKEVVSNIRQIEVK